MKNFRKETAQKGLPADFLETLARAGMRTIEPIHTVQFLSRGRDGQTVLLTAPFSQRVDEEYRRQLEDDNAKWKIALSAEMATPQWESLEQKFPGLRIIISFVVELHKMADLWGRIQQIGKFSRTHKDAVTREELSNLYIQFMHSVVGSLWKQLESDEVSEKPLSAKLEGSLGGNFSQLSKNFDRTKKLTPEQYATITRIFTLGIASTSANDWKELLANGSLVDINTLLKKDLACFPIIKEISQEILQIASLLHAFYLHVLWSCIDISHTDHSITVVWFAHLAHLLGTVDTKDMTSDQVVESLYNSVHDVLLAAQVLIPFEELDIVSTTLHHSQHMLDTIREERELTPDEHFEQAFADACRAFYESSANTRVCVSQGMIDRFFSKIDDSVPIETAHVFHQTAAIFQKANRAEVSVSVPIFTDTEEDSTPVLVQVTLNVEVDAEFSFSVNFLHDSNDKDIPRFFLHVNGRYSEHDIQIDDFSSWASAEKVRRQILTFLTSFLANGRVQELLIDEGDNTPTSPAPQRQPESKPAQPSLPARPSGRKRTTGSQATVPAEAAEQTEETEKASRLPNKLFISSRVKEQINQKKRVSPTSKREFWAYVDQYDPRNQNLIAAIEKSITPMFRAINVSPVSGKALNVDVFRIRPRESSDYRFLYLLYDGTAIIFSVENRGDNYASFYAGQLDAQARLALQEFLKEKAKNSAASV